MSKAKQDGRDFGVDFTNSELDGKSPEEAYKIIMAKMQERNTQLIAEEKKKASGSKDERYAELEAKLNKVSGDYKNLEGINQTLKSEFESKEKAFGEKLKGEKLSFRTKDIFSSFKWGKEVDDLRKKGFMATIAEKAKFDLDENDNLIVLDAKTGQKFSNPKAHSTYLSPQEFLEHEGIEAKVMQINNDGGKPAPAQNGWGGNNGNNNSNNNGAAPANNRQGQLAVFTQNT